MKKVFKIFTVFDIALWSLSVAAITIAFCLSSRRDYFALASSLTGVTALIFIVKGNVIGQFVTVIFAVLYGTVSYFFKYYGEMITYLGMSAPAAIFAIVSWLRHPYKTRTQVAINNMNGRKFVVVTILSAAVTVAFYFILKACNTTNLIVSTISVTTSFYASALTFLRSPFYGLAYASNDIVLIVMWSLATAADIAYIPMIICFSLFLIYDVYGFINWSKMKKCQSENAEQTDAAEIDTENAD